MAFVKSADEDGTIFCCVVESICNHFIEIAITI